MTNQQICDGYQNLIRELYTRVVVKPCSNQWNPYKDECFNVFFIPDNAGLDYMRQWLDGDWAERAEARGLPEVTLLPVCDSDVKEHYAHLFPEVFGKSTIASAKSKTSKPAAKRSKSRATKERFATSKN